MEFINTTKYTFLDVYSYFLFNRFTYLFRVTFPGNHKGTPRYWSPPLCALGTIQRGESPRSIGNCRRVVDLFSASSLTIVVEATVAAVGDQKERLTERGKSRYPLRRLRLLVR